MSELRSFSLGELQKLERMIQVELDRRQATVRQRLLKKIEKLAQSEGLTLEDVLPGPRTTSRASRPTKGASNKRVLPLRYWNPDNPEQGWSGHARRPRWVLDWLAKGGRLEGLERRPPSRALRGTDAVLETENAV